MTMWPIEEEYYRKQVFEIAVNEINKLKSKQRSILICWFLYDKTLTEIINISGGNDETVKHQKFVATNNIKRKVNTILTHAEIKCDTLTGRRIQ